MRKRIESQWLAFRAKVGLSGAPAPQLIEMRRVYYAGAEAFYRIVMTELTPGDEPTADEQRMLLELYEELDEFAQAIADGVA